MRCQLRRLPASGARFAVWPLFVSLSFWLTTGVSQAGEARILKWEDLIPRTPISESPINSLSVDEVHAVRDVARLRWLERQNKASDAVRTERRDAESKLSKQGINVDELLDRYKQYKAQRRSQRRALNESINGQTIKIAGYLLPLEFGARGATDFLLVPNVGACIHVPPPPPNQIIVVKSRRRHEVKGLFEPVWVAGRITTTSDSIALSFVDGQRNVETGYSIFTARIDDFKR